MNIAQALENKHSKAQAEEIVQSIVMNPSKMEELMECFFSDNIRICQRAAWPLGMLGEKAPELISPYTPQLIKTLHSKNSNDTIVRNILRTWKDMELDEEYEGEIFEICYDHFLNTKNAIAIRVFAMYICTNIACKYPELADELIPEIELNLSHDSPGIRSGSKTSLKRLLSLKK